eukprot:TRINITY_DN11639_c1_g1_i1.p1 TRINITY_DN11639_c1_g1~~TRINITY_DN11639_c1_g1_i1.p1  ORF type:complete len:360 (-),score=74.39 TRINITY_DN11639_c1_g1_i1:176-1207(-)
MSRAMVRALVVLAAGVATAYGDSHMDELWKDFLSRFERVFKSSEEAQLRREIFEENQDHIRELNAKSKGATYSHLSPFADWTMEEFDALNTFRPAMMPSTPMAQAPLLATSDLPESFDWREKGAVNPVQNQGKCGSCWAFAAVANIEGQNFVNGTRSLLKLSEQQLVDCDKATGNDGCLDGYSKDAYADMVENKWGLEEESTYPYTSQNGKAGICHAETKDQKVFVGGYLNISQDEDQMAAALMKYGPLAIAINARPQMWYKKGIDIPDAFMCRANKVNHAMNIVGFGVENKTKYWIIRNTYGPAWGEEGYYRIQRGVAGCGLNTMVVTALVTSTGLTSEVLV